MVLAVRLETPLESVVAACQGRGVMTRNRTALDLLSAAGTEVLALLLLVLATGLAVTRYFSIARQSTHHVEMRVRRRAARRQAA